MLGLTGTGQATVMGIQVLDTGVFGGIILGCITGAVFNKYSNKQFPIALSMFSGVRFPFLIMIIISWIMGAGFCIVWPPVQGAISSVAGIIKESGNIGLFIYGMLNKLLVPTGLHHLIYTPFLRCGWHPDAGRSVYRRRLPHPCCRDGNDGPALLR